MAHRPLALIRPQPALSALGTGFAYAPGCKTFIWGPTEGAAKKNQTPNPRVYILGLCFGLPLPPLPLHTALRAGVGPLGQAHLWQCCCWDGREVPVATSLHWVARRPWRSAPGWKRTPEKGSRKERYGRCCSVEKMERGPSEMLGERRGPEDASRTQGDWGSLP